MNTIEIKSLKIEWHEGTERLNDTEYKNIDDLHQAIKNEYNNSLEEFIKIKAPFPYVKYNLIINLVDNSILSFRLDLGLFKGDFNPFKDNLTKHINELATYETEESIRVEQIENRLRLLKKLKNHKTYLKILKESHGGIIYNINKEYESLEELAEIWSNIEHKENEDGITKGLMCYVLEKIQKQ